ncbi:MAG: DUF929 family protein, partial [Acidimicrobiales bacterium]
RHPGPRAAQRRAGRSRGPGGPSTTRTVGIFGSAFVILAVVIIVLLSTLGGGGTASASLGRGIPTKVAPASIVNGLANVPPSKFAEARLGGGQVVFVGGPVKKLSGQPSLTLNGKPLVVFVGAHYCPFCAATRWPLAIALDQFGSFTGLGLTASSPVDFAPNTHSLDWSGATYHSKYLAFSETEETTNTCSKVVVNPRPPPAHICASLADYGILQRPDALARRLTSKYDSPTYWGQNAGGIPFIDIGNRFIENGAPFPGSLTAYPPISLHGYSWAEIVNSLQAPIAGSPGQAILGAANVYMAALCEVTGGRPGSVCNQSYVKFAAKTLG